MKKIVYFFVFACFFIYGNNTNAMIREPQISYGGRVFLTTVPGVVCAGFGLGPVITSSNITRLVSGAYGAATSTTPTGAVGVVANLYGSLPTFTNAVQFVGMRAVLPQPGGQILGTQKFYPNFNKCMTPAGFPIPVFDSFNYNTSFK